MIRRSIRATLDTNTAAELRRVRQWCASSSVSEGETALILNQVASNLSELRSSALTVSSTGSTFQATREIKTSKFVIEITLSSGQKQGIISQLFKWLGL
jgi:hypothetical protein